MGSTIAQPPFRLPSNLASIKLEGAWKFDFPSGHTLTRGGAYASWDVGTDGLSTSDVLWLSGGYHLVDAICQSPEALPLVGAFMEWVHNEAEALRSLIPLSWDHSTAQRINTCVYLLSGGILNDEQEKTVAGVLSTDLEWAQRTGSVRMNNHGVFLLEAMLYAWENLLLTDKSRVLSQVPASVGVLLPEIIRKVYGDDGWCGENSPQYDRTWLLLFERLLAHHRSGLDAAGVTRLLTDAVEKAQFTSRLQIQNEGFYVPRGDTNRLQTKLAPTRGTNWSMRNGIWLYNDGRIFVHAVAGYSNLAHKHVDDTQLYLSLAGVDFFLDGGMHSFDYRDPRIPALKSALGHSALGVGQLDGLPPWKAYAKGAEVVTGELSDPTENSVVLTKRVGARARVQRQIRISNGNVYVRDQWEISSGAPVIRFLLAADCVVTTEERRVRLRRGGTELCLSFLDDIDVAVIEAEDHAPYRGWYSTGPGSLTAGRVLELLPRETSRAGCVEYRIGEANPLDPGSDTRSARDF